MTYLSRLLSVRMKNLSMLFPSPLITSVFHNSSILPVCDLSVGVQKFLERVESSRWMEDISFTSKLLGNRKILVVFDLSIVIVTIVMIIMRSFYVWRH